MMFRGTICGLFLEEQLQGAGEYALCFSVAKLSHSPGQKGSDAWGGIAERESWLLAYSKPVTLLSKQNTWL